MCKYNDRAVSLNAVLSEIDRWIGYLDEDMIMRIQTGIKKLPSVILQPCEDAISRRAAIEAINTYWLEMYKPSIDGYINCLEQLPNVASNRPKGHWIEKDDYLYVCSECGQYIYSETEHEREEFHAFCGRCGADMRKDGK